MESMCNRSIMPYSSVINIDMIKYLGLFDNVPYEHFKKIEECDDMMDVEIEDLPCKWEWHRITRFKFELDEKEYVVDLEYHINSPMGMTIVSNLYCDTEEEDNDEESDDEEDESILNYYICKHCYALDTALDDVDCQKCGNTYCVLLFQEKNAVLALEKAKAM